MMSACRCSYDVSCLYRKWCACLCASCMALCDLSLRDQSAPYMGALVMYVCLRADLWLVTLWVEFPLKPTCSHLIISLCSGRCVVPVAIPRGITCFHKCTRHAHRHCMKVPWAPDVGMSVLVQCAMSGPHFASMGPCGILLP